MSKKCGGGEAILYLWQNSRTVVIGRNQNAWAECRMDAMERDSVILARRSTGGGAVYHDLGNLNFSFILPRTHYAMARQLKVVLRALGSLGIDARFTGRNDLTLEGRKFSGNAYRLSREIGLHHGTLLVDADMTALPLYLNADPEKLKSKGVKSVASRVVNLKESVPWLTAEKLVAPLQKAFLDEYGFESMTFEDRLPDDDLYRNLYGLCKSRRWLLGRSPLCRAVLRRRFAWGGVEMNFDVKGGAVRDLRIYSDAMDGELIKSVERCLEGRSFQWDSLIRALKFRFPGVPEAADLALWFSEHPAL